MFTSTITIEGRLAQDPTTLEALTEFVVLTNRRGRDDAGEWGNTDTTRYTVKAFRSLGEAAAGLEKGEKVVVAGSIITETWEDRDSGQNRYKPVILADAIGVSI